MYGASSFDGLSDWVKPYADAGATRMIVAYVPAGEDLWSEIEAFLESADYVSAFA
jgi:hypothetical protein